MDIKIEKAVNLALLRQQLDETGVAYSMIFSGDVMTLRFDDFDSMEIGRLILDTHDAEQLTAEQVAQLEEQEETEVFLANVSDATTAIGAMVQDTMMAIQRIQASEIDTSVKLELVAMNQRTVELVMRLTPFIERVVALIEVHTTT